ncbi:MAG: hypothetical protein BMS9Abin10_0829 [Gammaproteobacteria bacterium]|nr:MAG: hypothetical protein BMS9Abin10_0829 [Gammaproteobacteria bacterium]
MNLLYDLPGGHLHGLAAQSAGLLGNAAAGGGVGVKARARIVRCEG